MKIEKLSPGMVVWDVHKERMGNTTMRSYASWAVLVISIDLNRQTVMASWNGNPARAYYKNSWSKWRKTEPVWIRSGLGKRPATRAEIKVMKEMEAK